MKNIQISLIGFGQDVVIKGDGWYMLSLDLAGLYFYASVTKKGVDYGHSGKLKIVGVDVDGY